MSTEHPSPQGHDQPDRLTAAMTVGSAALIYAILTDLPAWARLLVLALAGLVIYRRVALGVSALLAIAFGFAVLDYWSIGNYQDELTLLDVFMAAALIVLVVFSWRYIELDQRRFVWRRRSNNGTDTERPIKTKLRPATLSIICVVVALVLSATLLWLFPLSAFAMPNRFYFQPPPYRAIVILWILGIAVIAPLAALSIVSWRKLRANQAQIYILHTAAREIRREHRAIERGSCKTETQAR